MTNKKLNILLVLFVLILKASERKEPFVYKYESSPVYTWGYAQFWGQHYSNYDIEENVLSLSLFTDSLYLDKGNSLKGFGQYLFIDDIFISKNDTLFPEGIYQIVDSIGEKIIAPGKLYDSDGVKTDIGAYVYFIEKNDYFTKRKFITKGDMTVSYLENTIRFDFNFILDDKTDLKGYYLTSKLTLYNESVANQSVKSRAKLNLRRPFIHF